MLRKCSLEILDISHNIIGDDGIIAIAEALSDSKICELYIGRCDITFAGARSLAAALEINSNVKRLDAYHNPITVEGARLILRSSVRNKICKEVGIDRIYRDDDEVQEMLHILMVRSIVFV